MASKIICRKQGDRLVPVTLYDEELFAELPEGKDLNLTVTMFRSARHHRFYWAVLGKVVENCERWPSAAALNDALKIHLGYVKQMVLLSGEVVLVPESTSWAAMDQLAFKVFFDGALNTICSEILPGIDQATLVAEVEQMLGVRLRDLWKEGS